MTEDLPDLKHQLALKFWDWMESIRWLEAPRDLYATELKPELGADLAAEVSTPGGGKSLLLTRVKDAIKPSDVKLLANRLREMPQREGFRDGLRLMGLEDPQAIPCFILASKWLSPRTIDRIAAEDRIGWFDLAGNAHIEFPGAYIHAQGVSNPFKAKERTITWTSRQAQRVLRELLEPKNAGRRWRQRDLSTECFPNVSLGTVNKVAKRLLDSAYAEETPQGLRVTDPSGLLRDWAKHHKPIHQSARSFYTVLHGDSLQDRLRKVFEAHRASPPVATSTIALAGTSAAVWFAPFVRTSALCCYTTPAGERALVEALDLQAQDKGANVTLWVTPRSGPFRHRIDLPNGMTTTSLVQTFLDLHHSGERGREAAEHLLAAKLEPLWNEWRSNSQ